MKKKILVILLAMTLACVSACGNSGEDKPSIQPETELSDSIVSDDETEKNESVEDNTEDVKDGSSEDTESTQNTEKNENKPDNDRKDDPKDSDDTETSKDSSSNNKNESDTGAGSNGNTGNNDNIGNNANTENNGNTGNNGNSTNNNSGNTNTSVETSYVSSYTQEENQLADAIIAKIIRSSMGEFESVKAIHDYLLMNVDYDYQNYLNNTIPDVNHTAKGALTNKYAVCDGYSNAFQLLCSKIGISCEIVSGTSKGGSHAWNQVKIEGNWYNIDVTWDDPATINGVTTTFNDHSGNSYEYFCIPDSIMYKDHQTSNAPHKCTSPALFERALKAGTPWDDARYISSSNELVELIKTEGQKGNYTTSFYMKQTLFTGELGDAFMDCISQAGIKFSGISWSYFTYFEGTTNPGTFYKIELTIRP